MTASRFTTEEIKQKYDERAREYALFERVQEILGMARLRRRLSRRASGSVLEAPSARGRTSHTTLGAAASPPSTRAR